MERRLAAILAADVQGYSHLTELNEESSTATLRSYSAVVEEAIAAHRGHSLSWAGDGVVAEFPSVVEAIRCAAEIQDEIAERNADLPEDQRMQFRIGVNLGDVIAEGDRLYGTGVNVAVRLQQLAEPGGIFVSQTVYDQVRKIVGIPFEDVGERHLKNITDPVHVYRILPAPPTPLHTFLWRIRRSPGLGAAAAVAVLLVVLGAVPTASAGGAVGSPAGGSRHAPREPVHRGAAFPRHECNP
jgi:class 3 adenylate cyclase